MRDRIITNSFRTIKKVFPRFLSLLIMSMLGVFTFSGLLATAPDMIDTLDKYLDKYNTYDIKINSTMGLVDNDIKALNNIKKIDKVEGIYSIDSLITLKEEYVINISSISKDINNLELIDGRLPLTNDEIVVEQNLLDQNKLKLNETITITNKSLKNNKYKIVGIVKSSLYFNSTLSNQPRGNTSIGSGVINYYGFLLEDSFNLEYYTTIYLTVENAKRLITSQSNYDKLIESINSKITDIKETQQKQRYDEIYNKAKKEIDDKENEALAKLQDTKNTLDIAKSKLDSYKYGLDNSYKDLMYYKDNLVLMRNTLDEKSAEFNKALIDNKIEYSKIDETVNNLTNKIDQLTSLLLTLDPISEEYLINENMLKELNTTKELLITLKATKEKLDLSENEYTSKTNEYNNLFSYYETNLNNYNSNLYEYNNNYNLYLNEKEKAENEIQKAREELEKIQMPKWYINDRTDYSTYVEYVDDTKSIGNLGKVFPLLFYAVAVLVSLISMNRMVEDDRTEIGTLKSLGYSNTRIMNKYLLFSSLATISGGIIGSSLGIIIIPKLIFEIYKILFDLPSLVLGLNLKITIMGFLIAFFCVCGTTIFTVLKVVKEKPSQLMRPKAPKNGKRVFLERITLIWKKLKFSNKVTIRNLFRYKKRVLVTIFGIAGCTSLIVCGFGIKDSIVDIAYKEYNKIFKYDAMAYVNVITEERYNEIFSNPSIKEAIKIQNISAEVDNTGVNLFVSKDTKDLSKIVNLVDRETLKLNSLKDDEVVITDKLADLKKLNVGDKIKIFDVNNIEYEYRISSIVKNYMGHYIYMNENTFEKSNQEFKYNVVFLNLNNEKDLSNQLLKNDEILNIVFISALIDSVLNMLKSLDKVILILIILASLLAFVVLYNLSNININERKREIATLKVLGFYNKEVDNYITKETILLTIIGISLGLVLGYYLTNIVISTVEIEKARFIKEIKFNSYLYSITISILFTIIVNIVTHFSLKKIDMIESLKSVE